MAASFQFWKLYIATANIGEFADTHNLTVREASNYLNRCKGIEFLTEHYEAEHQLSLYDSIQDLTRICNNNVGGIEYSPHGQTNKKSLHLIDDITKDIIENRISWKIYQKSAA